jgi:hypothetical protein
MLIVGGLVAFAVVTGWAILRWQLRGRDPTYTDDASVLLAEPPEGLTAATATIVDGGAPRTAFLAALLDLASRGEITFRDETPDATGAHRVGIAIHATPVDDPRAALNRRQPVGEGETWLLANLRGYAASDAAGAGRDARAMAVMGAMAGVLGGAPDRQPPMMALLRDVIGDPAAIAADPGALAARIEAATGRAPTSHEMTSLTTWLQAHQSALSGLASSSASNAYIAADRAAEFHSPLGFGTLVENYARRNGWIVGFSFIARWKWHGLAVVELLVGLVVAALDAAAQGLVYGAGLGIVAGGIATWFIAPYMASRTREGAIMKARLAAYRRTLKATFDGSAELDEAIKVAGMAWVETPDQALVWGVALGLRAEVEALLRRTAGAPAGGTAPARPFIPRWIERAIPAAAAQASAEPGTGPDIAEVFAGIERIGTTAERPTTLIGGT